MGVIDTIRCAQFILKSNKIDLALQLLDILEYYMLTITKTDEVHKIIELYKISSNASFDEFIVKNLNGELIKNIFNVVYVPLNDVLEMLKKELYDIYTSNVLVGGYTLDRHNNKSRNKYFVLKKSQY